LLLVRDQRLEQAVPYLRRAADLAVDQPRYAYVYALALQGSGDSEQALAVLGQANRRSPGDRDILQALVDLHREQGDAERAQYFARELARRYPQAAQRPGR
ncbi:MAG: hypothetical protein P8106_11355, partial [Gammaproteobacteria bacterium]